MLVRELWHACVYACKGRMPPTATNRAHREAVLDDLARLSAADDQLGG